MTCGQAQIVQVGRVDTERAEQGVNFGVDAMVELRAREGVCFK